MSKKKRNVTDYVPGVAMESSSDEEDQNTTTEWLKMIVINVCNGNKVAVLITDKT